MEQGPNYREVTDVVDESILGRDILRNIDNRGSAANLQEVIDEVVEEDGYHPLDVKAAYLLLRKEGMVSMLPSPDKEMTTPQDVWVSVTKEGHDFQSNTLFLD